MNFLKSQIATWSIAMVSFAMTWQLSGIVISGICGRRENIADVKPYPVPHVMSADHPQFDRPTFSPYGRLDFANELIRVMFPAGVKSNKVAISLLEIESNDEIKSFEDYYRCYFRLNQAAGTMDLDWRWPPMESYWLDLVSIPERADQFLGGERIAALTAQLTQAKSWIESNPPDVVVKSVLQRDLYHTFGIVLSAARSAQTPLAKERGQLLLPVLADLVRQLRLSPSEILELSLRVKELESEIRIEDSTPVALSDERIPAYIFGETQIGVVRMHFRLDEHTHFSEYRGRSWFRIYLSVPGWTPGEIEQYWDECWNGVGPRIHVSPVPRDLPAGTETTLVRTMSLFADDWSVFDSGLVEELLIRYFRREKPQYDPGSSDFRGTLHFQYLLDRHRLFSRDQVMGLRRVHDDEPSFVGIFPRTNDLTTSNVEVATQSRWNCLNCHAESVYGANTVFALGHRRLDSLEESLAANSLIIRNPTTGRFQLLTEEFLALKAFVDHE